jgi:flavorubredoxin
MHKVLIANASKRKETRLISDYIAEGLRKSGVFINVLDINDIEDIKLLKGYDAVILDSGIYINDLLNKLELDSSLADKIDFQRKIGGAFGGPTCSKNAISNLFHTMKNVLKVDMVNDPLVIDSISDSSGKRKAKQYGQEIAEKLIN